MFDKPHPNPMGQIEYQKFLQQGGDNFPMPTKRNIIRFVEDYLMNHGGSDCEKSEQVIESEFEKFFGKFTI